MLLNIFKSHQEDITILDLSAPIKLTDKVIINRNIRINFRLFKALYMP